VGIIHILDYNTVIKIAAGEVIERPASVVRELIDNSIDAGAKRISIHLSNGGKTYIEVQDDGCGMAKEDILICTQNHTTSKISSFEDIFSLNSLGFRGEALSSIAEVSELTILSKTRESQTGYKLEVSYGKQVSFQEHPVNSGTTVIVKNLFSSIPARLKFLSTPAVELKMIDKEIIKKALAFPEVSFELISDGKRKYISTSKNTYMERIADFFPDAVPHLLPVEKIGDSFSIMGFVSRTNFIKPNRLYEYFFVNKRAVEWKNFYFSIQNAYGNLIPKGFFPAIFLYLSIDPSKLDVNVHPMKREVKFQDERKIAKEVEEALNSAIMQDRGIAEADEGIMKFTSYEKKISRAISEFMENKDGRNHYIQKNIKQIASGLFETKSNLLKLPNEKQKVSDYRFIGIAFGTYIILEGNEEVLFLDQHAMHERINYEKLKEKFEKKLLAPQELLIPIKFEIPVSLVDDMKENVSFLKAMGFDIEHFGGNTFVIRSTPAFVDYKEASDIVMGFVEVLEENRSNKIPDFTDRAIKQMACKKSIRATENLSKEEVLELVKEWEKTPNRFSCPHGRPVSFSISRIDIEKQFKRQGF